MSRSVVVTTLGTGTTADRLRRLREVSLCLWTVLISAILILPGHTIGRLILLVRLLAFIPCSG